MRREWWTKEGKRRNEALSKIDLGKRKGKKKEGPEEGEKNSRANIIDIAKPHHIIRTHSYSFIEFYFTHSLFRSYSPLFTFLRHMSYNV